MGEIIIRKSKMSDSEVLEKTFQTAIRNDFGYYPIEAKREFVKIWDAKFFRKRRPITFIAVLKEKIVGFIIGNPQWRSSGVGSIDWLWVDAKYRNQGIAKGLLRAIEEFFAEMGHHKVILNADNELTQSFYPSAGYTLEGTMKDHYWHLNELRYAKALKK